MCTLLSIIGEDAVKVFYTFEYGDGESEYSIQDVLNTFEEYCNPRRNTIYFFMSGINVATGRVVNPDRVS